jgi:hypothetical protein
MVSSALAALRGWRWSETGGVFLALARGCAWAAFWVAGLIGAWCLYRGIVTQIHRLALELSHGLGFSDPVCSTGYCDYTMFWLAGFLARHGEAALLYDPVRYTAAAARVLPYHAGYWPFVYPPTILPFFAVLSGFPLVAGYYGFCIAGTVASLWLLSKAGIRHLWIFVGVLSPVEIWNIYIGQFGLLCGALLLAGLIAMKRHPRRAGVVLALLCIKPQYALLVPVAVLASRSWVTLMLGGGMLAGLVCLSLTCGGVATWLAYFGAGGAAMNGLLRHGFGQGPEISGFSVFWMLRSLHAPMAIAYAGQAISAGLAALACWHLWSRPADDPPRRAAATVLLTLLATPYGYNDDLAVYSVLLLTLLRRDAVWRNALLAWLGVLPAFMPRFAMTFGFLPTPLLILTALVIIWRTPSAPA